jgi:hypothetical protein
MRRDVRHGQNEGGKGTCGADSCQLEPRRHPVFSTRGASQQNIPLRHSSRSIGTGFAKALRPSRSRSSYQDFFCGREPTGVFSLANILGT